MANNGAKNGSDDDHGHPPARAPHRFLGSLKDALMAAGRNGAVANVVPPAAGSPAAARVKAEATPSPIAKATAIDAETIAQTPVQAPGRDPRGARHEPMPEAMTRAIRGSDPRRPVAAAARTQLVRGRIDVARGEFHQDPVVGWLVVVGGNGLGAFRPIFEGNNTVGRARTQRIAIDFGDETISSEEQAYIRYDSVDRSFLFVPNLSKTNVVSVNSKKPTAAVALQAMDVITMGRTQLAFVPFCGGDFDWAELQDARG